MTDAKIQLRDLLISEWDPSATSLGKAPPIHTGRWAERKTIPCVALHGKDEGPDGGGATGYTAMSGSGGGGVQTISGAVTIDCVAGAWTHLEGAGPNGEDLVPKKLREELYQHASQIIVDHHYQTDLWSAAPGSSDEIVSTDDGGDGDPERVYITQFTADYLYERRPTQ